MKEPIYYPGFQVGDVDWLKFALLYLQALSPIIPVSGDLYLDESYRRLVGETDLIVPYRPGIEEGANATRDALDELERILRHPERYAGVFGQRDIVEAWRRPDRHTATLFAEKYTYAWERFCLRERLASESDLGLTMPEQLAALYMTTLAHAISDLRGLPAITDQPSLDHLAIAMHRANANLWRPAKTAQAIIQLRLPADLSQIGLGQVIQHRNRSGFRERQQAFHSQLDAFLSGVEGDADPAQFADTLGGSWADFGDEVAQVGAGAASVALGVWLVLQSPSASVGDALKELVGGIGFTVSGIVSVRNAWKHTRSKGHTRKFLADLRRLSPTQLPS